MFSRKSFSTTSFSPDQFRFDELDQAVVEDGLRPGGRVNVGFTPVREVSFVAPATRGGTFGSTRVAVTAAVSDILLAISPASRFGTLPADVQVSISAFVEPVTIRGYSIDPVVRTGVTVSIEPVAAKVGFKRAVAKATTGQIVMAGSNAIHAGYAQPSVMTVLNPTDNELMAMIALVRRRRSRRF